MPEPPAAARRLARRWLPVAAAGAGYAAIVVFLAWPLPAHLATALVDPMATGEAGAPGARADLDLNVWILAWTAHALATQPLRLFQANIFHPAPDTLALSEHLLGLAPVAAPVFWATGNAVLAYNVTILAVVWLTAVATFLLVRAWTGNGLAAFLAGSAFAFAPLNLFRWTRINCTPVMFFPLILLLAWRAAARPDRRALALLAVVTAWQLLAGVYIAYELAALLVAFAPALWWEARRHGRSGLGLALALAAAGVVLVPVAPAYLRALASGAVPDQSALVSSVARVSLGIRTQLAWLADALGRPVVALAAAGLFLRGPVPGHARLGLGLVALLGLVLGTGPEAPLVPGTAAPSLYALAMRLVPGFAGMRAPTRFIVLPLLAGAVLSGVGAATLAARAGRLGRAGTSVAAAVLALANLALVEARAPGAPLALEAVDVRGPEMAVYRWLRDQPGAAPVVELPALNSGLDTVALVATGRYLLGATLHWRPLVNGYSGHAPASDALLMTLAQRLPEPRAREDLCALAAPGWLVVHPRWLRGGREQWSSPAGLREAARFGDDLVYELAGRCGGLTDALRRGLAAPEATETLRGLPLRALPTDARRGRLRGRLPRRMAAGAHAWLWVDVESRSRLAWPGLSLPGPHVVMLQSRWRERATGRVVAAAPPVPLARDLAPGERLAAQVGVEVPAAGDYLLEVGLLQEGSGWFADAAGGRGRLRRRVRTGAPVAQGRGAGSPHGPATMH